MSAALMERVFVYGSLKRGGRFHRLLQRVPFLGEGVTCEPWLLHVGWDWPLLIADAPARWRGPVCGEVYAVDRLLFRRLDEVEDNGRLYLRRRICVRLVSGERMKVWAYFAHDRRLITRALRQPRICWSEQRQCQTYETDGRRSCRS